MPARRPKKKPVAKPARVPKRFALVRKLALALPGAEEGTSYGTPAFKVGKAMFVRLHQDNEAIVVLINFDERAMRMKTDPESFYITDHYLDYPAMLVRLATVDVEDLRELIEESWRRNAPEELIRQHFGDAPASKARQK